MTTWLIGTTLDTIGYLNAGSQFENLLLAHLLLINLDADLFFYSLFFIHVIDHDHDIDSKTPNALSPFLSFHPKYWCVVFLIVMPIFSY